MPISMSRTTTSLVAVGAGVILLSAAGGSFAQWSEGKDVATSPITAGHLKLEVENGAWFDTKGTSDIGDDASIDPASFRLVPGDQVEFRAKIKPDLVGDTLKAELAAKLPDASGDLKSIVAIKTTVDGSSDAVVLRPQDTAGGRMYDARVTITMPFGTATAPDQGEDKTLSLNNLKISLVQQQR